MSVKISVLALLLAAAPGTAVGQSVPEGIHKDASGPAEMCGLSGKDASDLAARVRVAPQFRRQEINSDRFELYATSDSMQQFVITRPTEAAYPAVTCRHAYQENGSWMMGRSMRCDADRAACDKLFIEFQKLDADLKRELSGR